MEVGVAELWKNVEVDPRLSKQCLKALQALFLQPRAELHRTDPPLTLGSLQLLANLRLPICRSSERIGRRCSAASATLGLPRFQPRCCFLLPHRPERRDRR